MILVWFVAGLLCFVSCIKTVPVESPNFPVEVPDTWTTKHRLESDFKVDWWTAFGNSHLNDLVEEAFQQNHDLAATAFRLEQAAATAQEAAAELYPQLRANIDGARRKQNFIGFPIPVNDGEVLSTTSTNLGVSLETSWEIDLWGRVSAAARSSAANYQAMAAELDAARLSIAGQTVKAWFALSKAAEQLHLSVATLNSFRESMYQVKERYEAGVRSSLDYRLSQANLETAEANLYERRQQLDLATRQIELLVGRYPKAVLTSPVGLSIKLSDIPAGIPSELVSRRPDLAAAERRFAASGELVSVARRARYPSFSLTAGGGTATAELTDLVSGNFGVWNLVGSLVQSVFDGGRLRANINRAEASQNEMFHSYVQAVLNAYFEVERTLAAEKFLVQRETALVASAKQSRAAERLADERYRFGLENYVTVLESQRRSFNAEDALITVRHLRVENRVDLYLALGGGFDRQGPRTPSLSEDK